MGTSKLTKNNIIEAKITLNRDYVRIIIRRMLDFYRRAWKVFFPLFVALLGFALQSWIYLQNYRISVTITFISLSFICLLIGTVGIISDIKESRRKDKVGKEEHEHPWGTGEYKG